MKTAYELAMEKLRKQDAERGESQKPLTDAQREEIAGIRKVYQARLAEREILHRDELLKARASGDPEAVRAVEEGYQRDRARLEDERESKVRAAREGRTPGGPKRRR
ncbi:MAG: hypothetical protein ACREAA_07495 [Candidatus Polarisedimenticolia bacterium]